MKLHLLALTTLAAAAPLPLLAIDLASGDKGITIDAGPAGTYTLEAPELTTTDGKKEKPVWESGEKGGEAKYANGAIVEMTITGKEEILVAFKDLPESSKSLMFSMLIPINLNNGGTVSAEGKAPVSLPEEVGEQHVITGTTIGTFKLADASGAGFSLSMPTNWYTVQDNRKWNWNTFAFQGLYDLNAKPEEREFTVTVKDLK
jgi:hypothetical protein